MQWHKYGLLQRKLNPGSSHPLKSGKGIQKSMLGSEEVGIGSSRLIPAAPLCNWRVWLRERERNMPGASCRLRFPIGVWPFKSIRYLMAITPNAMSRIVDISQTEPCLGSPVFHSKSKNLNVSNCEPASSHTLQLYQLQPIHRFVEVGLPHQSQFHVCWSFLILWWSFPRFI